MRIFEERGITHLDLHGVKHQDVSDEVINFIFQYQHLLPLIIICGNSNKMIEIVSQNLNSKSSEFFFSTFILLNIRFNVK